MNLNRRKFFAILGIGEGLAVAGKMPKPKPEPDFSRVYYCFKARSGIEYEHGYVGWNTFIQTNNRFASMGWKLMELKWIR